GGAGADTMTGGAGNDIFVLSNHAITLGAGHVDTITDYATGEDIVDITFLNVAAGVDIAAGGYVRVTSTGQIQVDITGSSNGAQWVTVANINLNSGGNNSVTFRYLENGVAKDVTVARAAAPVGIDLDGDGVVSFLAVDAGVSFDYGGGLVATAWVAGNDGILVRDTNRDGQVTHDELVFATTGSDLDGLRIYDSNGDGWLTADDDGFELFAVWRDANSNGVVDDGEMVSLIDLGISGISLTSDGVIYSAAGGDVTVVGTGTYTRTDGSTGVLADAMFATGAALADEQQKALAANSNTVAIAAAAAAGLAAAPAAAAAQIVGRELYDGTDEAQPSGGESPQAPVAAEDQLRPMLGNETREAIRDASDSALGLAQDEYADGHANHGASINLGQRAETADLLQPTDAAISETLPMAASVHIPPAEWLMPMAAAADEARATAEVSRVLVDALDGGDGGELDIGSVLASLSASPAGEGSGVESLASMTAGSPWDGAAAFGSHHVSPWMDNMTVQIDAIQPV
ncbi:MAG TPA: hypothetical protein VM346_08200, partial [Sphingomicrobium sp.]|nr:hypothetical protein [Sphingomicrobium sp.]